MNNGWDNKIEHQINDWKHKCQLYHALHNKYKNYYLSIYNYGATFTILVSSLGTIFSTVVLAQPNFYLNVLLLVTSITTTTINGYLTTHNIVEKLSKHNEISTKYLELIYNIEQELALTLEQRTNGNEYIKILSLEMSHILELGANLPMIDNLNLEDANKLCKTYKKQLEYTSDNDMHGLNKTQKDNFTLYYDTVPHVTKELKLLRLNSMV
jgi:hypothetical protein